MLFNVTSVCSFQTNRFLQCGDGAFNVIQKNSSILFLYVGSQILLQQNPAVVKVQVLTKVG